MSSFVISGRIFEKESKKPISGLFVRPSSQGDESDAEMLIAVTDRSGRFRMEYKKSSATRLFKSRPRVHLSVYTPPWRFLLETPQAIPWNTRPEEQVELYIPRKLLDRFSPSCPDRVVEAGLSFNADALKVRKQGRWNVPRLPDFQNSGPVGAPALPQQHQTIALPLRARNLRLVIKPGRAVRVPAGRKPMPVQPPRLDLSPAQLEKSSEILLSLSPRYSGTTQPFPQRLVVVGQPTVRSFIQLVRVCVQPVQYDAVERNYIFYPHLRYTIHYDLSGDEKASVLPPISQEHLEGLQGQLDDLRAIPAKDLGVEVIEYETLPTPSVTPDVKCIILTSNKAWPASIPNPEDNSPWPESVVFPGSGKIKPPTLQDGLDLPASLVDGGPIAQFERLAKWKTQRGMRTKVVTVEDILNRKGQFGDCIQDARDLQEVIRNFVKKVHHLWNIEYLLIGGSIRIVPMRYLLGYVTLKGEYPAWDYSQVDDLQDLISRCFYVDETAQNPRRVYLCHDAILGMPDAGTLLCAAGGRAFAHKSTPGTNDPGWYFADENFTPVVDYAAWGLQTHLHLVLEGPNTIIDTNYYWATLQRFMPSDLYYACLETNNLTYAPPKNSAKGGPVQAHFHDWDLNHNRLYGQFRWEETLQSEVTIDSRTQNVPDLWVGRAPIDTAEEAQNFVDKILTYEQLCSPEGEPVDPAYLKQIVLAGDVMDSEAHLAAQERNWNDCVEPEPGTFSYQVNEKSVLTHLPSDLLVKLQQPNHVQHLLARFHQPDNTGTDLLIPRGEEEDETSWYFVDEQTGQRTSAVSEFVRAQGIPFSIKPWKLLWRHGENDVNDAGANGCEELLSGSLQPSFPEFNNISRYYVEFFNFPNNAYDLTPESIRTRLDLGCHFLFLRGHGSFNGLSMVWCYETPGYRPDFRNHNRYFIAYAQSCNTAEPDFKHSNGDTPRSLGEVMTVQKDGAIAYVGYTRIGVGAGNQQAQIFWQKLKKKGRLGPAAGSTSDGSLFLNDMYQYYNQVLYGDPEMPIWTAMPKTYRVIYPDFIDVEKDALCISVLYGNEPLRYQRVTVSAWPDGSSGPIMYKTLVTGSTGLATFDLKGFSNDISEITLVVSPAYPHRADNYKPFVATIPAGKSQGGWRRCINCQTLFYRYSQGNPSDNHDCPAGGPHVAAASEHYRLHANAHTANGQQNWRWCKKCQALHYDDNADNSSAGCKNGESHDASSSGKYVLDWEITYSEYAHWRWCDKCNVLYRNDSASSGKCFYGDVHSEGGTAYVVPVE